MQPAPPSDVRTAARRRRERIFAVVTVLASVTLVLLAAEGVIRWVKRDSAFQPDPDLIRSLRPSCRQPLYSYDTDDNLNGRSTSIPEEPRLIGYGVTNELGLRMSTPIGPKKPGETRVLLLGDSYTEGLEVPPADRFAEVAQRLLDGSEPGRWLIVNGGIQNGSPAQYELQLERFLPSLRPDVVVICLAPNDLTDDTTFERSYGFRFDAGGRPTGIESAAQLRMLRDVWLLRYLEVFLSRYAPRAHDVVFPLAHPEIDVPEWKMVMCGTLTGLEDAYARRTGRYLEQLRHRVESTGAELEILLIQYLYVYPDEPFYEPRFPTLRSELAGCGCAPDGGAAYNAFIERFLAERRIPFCNPRTALLEAKRVDPTRKLWNFYDYHFSSAGNRIVGEQLAAFLRSRRSKGSH